MGKSLAYRVSCLYITLCNLLKCLSVGCKFTTSQLTIVGNRGIYTISISLTLSTEIGLSNIIQGSQLTQALQSSPSRLVWIRRIQTHKYAHVCFLCMSSIILCPLWKSEPSSLHQDKLPRALVDRLQSAVFQGLNLRAGTKLDLPPT